MQYPEQVINAIADTLRDEYGEQIAGGPGEVQIAMRILRLIRRDHVILDRALANDLLAVTESLNALRRSAGNV